MIDNIEIGDEVLTAGGFFATVLEVADDEVTVELSPGAQARLSKRAIAAVFAPEAEMRRPSASQPSKRPAKLTGRCGNVATISSCSA